MSRNLEVVRKNTTWISGGRTRKKGTASAKTFDWTLLVVFIAKRYGCSGTMRDRRVVLYDVRELVGRLDHLSSGDHSMNLGLCFEQSRKLLEDIEQRGSMT